jgi:ferrous iron transport protein B
MPTKAPTPPTRAEAHIAAILELLDLRDPIREQHGHGVAVIAELIGRDMGFPEDRLERLRRAALVHDVGMIGVPVTTVAKPARLTEEEFAQVKSHPGLSRTILLGHPDFADVAEIAGSHHEHWDGNGYPSRLKKEAIPLESRIIAVADALQAMLAERPYRERYDFEEACAEISHLAGGQFCPTVVRHFNNVRHQIPDVLAERLPAGEGDPEVPGRPASPATRKVADTGEDDGLSKPAPGALAPAARSTEVPHIPLHAATPGTTAVVEHVGGDPQFRRRLLELGLVPGAVVRVVRVAPLGDPVEVDLRGASFTLRKGEASLIAVRPVQQDADYLKVPRPVLANVPASRRFRIAVAGNPNAGKTTLFNALTGAKGRVGNYPGITVERLTARMTLPEGIQAELIDVPGTYSLTARSREEQVAIDELLGRAGSAAPDLVVVVLNAITLERSLYLLLQIQELGYPIVGVMNMMDEAWAARKQIDLPGLARSLGVPLTGCVARTGHGLDELRDALSRMLRGDLPAQDDQWRWQPNPDLLRHVDEMVPALGELLGPDAPLNRRRAFALWNLMSLSVDDDLQGIPEDLRRHTLELQQAIRTEGHDLDLEVTQSRYGHIDALVKRHVSRLEGAGGVSLTQRLDSVLTHPLWGSLTTVLVLGLVFMLLFDWITPAMDAIKWLFGKAGEGIRAGLGEGLLARFLADGLVGGVGAVLVFLPQIIVLFLCIGVLESSGYLSRTAFLMDRLMRKLGLNGKAFVPMLSGYACAVPAILATRTLESKRDRLLTMMVIPLMSCSARLPVYTLLIAALFPAKQKVLGPIPLGVLLMLGIYAVSTLLALLAAGVLSRTVLRGRRQPLLLELPPYRMPAWRDVGRLVTERVGAFLKTAGTIILIASAVLWVLLTFPRPDTYSRDYVRELATARAAKQTETLEDLGRQKRAEELEHSFAGRFGRVLEPIIAPLGFDWKIGVGLIGAFAAREVFVSTLAQVYGSTTDGGGAASLSTAIQKQRRPDGTPVYTLWTGLSLIVFFMIALQCLSTMAVVRLESGGWKWVFFQLGYLTTLAYLASLTVFQLGRAFG